MRRFLILALFAATACEPNDECIRLDAMLEEHERAFDRIESSAKQHDKLSAAVDDAKTRAETILTELGVDMKPEAIDAAVKARLAPFAGRYERRTEKESLPGTMSTEDRLYVQVEFAAKDVDQALERFFKIAAQPPLFELRALGPAKKGSWAATLRLAMVPQVPISTKTQALTLPAAPSSVPTAFGFCGASKKRAAITQIREAMEKARAKAEGVSALLPGLASWRGLERRARQIHKAENETRRLSELALKTAVETGVTIRGVAYDEPTLNLDAAGSADSRRRLELALEKQVEGLSASQAPKGSIRLAITNEFARKSGFGGRHGPG